MLSLRWWKAIRSVGRPGVLGGSSPRPAPQLLAPLRRRDRFTTKEKRHDNHHLRSDRCPYQHRYP